MLDSFQSTKHLLAENVKAKRKAKGLSQEALALEAQIDRTYISQIERQICNPSLLILCSIANVLECSVDVLLAECRLGA